MSDKPGLIIGRPVGEDLNLAARYWLDQHTSLVAFASQQQYAIGASDLWEWLEKPYTVFRNWWKEASVRQKLEEGKDFVCRTKNHAAKPGRGGHNQKDYWLTAQAALRIAASEATNKGRALLRALVDIVDRIERGDPELAAYINRRCAERGGPVPYKPWSERLTRSFMAHYAYLNGRHPGWWSVLVATNTILMALEDVVLDHCLPCKPSDLPDGSIGQRWAAYRRERGLQAPTKEAPLYLPEQGRTVQVTTYSPDERGMFEAWLFSQYMPAHLPEYLVRKFHAFGKLPPCSAADHACLKLTGKHAQLEDQARRAIDQAPGRIIKANPGQHQLN